MGTISQSVHQPVQHQEQHQHVQALQLLLRYGHLLHQGSRPTKIHNQISRKREADISSSKYVLANQTGPSPLHTAWYINEKGDKVWLKFDSSIPCTRFSTTETRFYKPKLHKICPDPYADKKVRGM